MCDPAQQIPTYTDGGTIPGNVTNIHCISLETDLLTTETLTINGIPYTPTSFSSFLDKTQNQIGTSSPILTTFTGSVVVPTITSDGGYLKCQTLYCDNIGSSILSGNLSVTGALTCLSEINVSSLSTASANIATFLQPNFSNGQSMSLLLGVSNSSSNGATFQYNYISSGNSANNILIKIIGATAQIAMTGTTTTLTGPLSLLTAPIPTRQIQVGQVFSSTMESNTFMFSPNCKRIEIHFVDVVRKLPNNFESVLQFGVQPSTWDTTGAHYEGSTFSYSAGQTAYWGIAPVPGMTLINAWPTGGTYGDFLWSGKIVCSYFGLVTGVHVWSINGSLSTPNIVNVAGTDFGPYTVWHMGHYSTATSVNMDMLKLTCQDPTNTFQSGYVTITTE